MIGGEWKRAGGDLTGGALGPFHSPDKKAISWQKASEVPTCARES